MKWRLHPYVDLQTKAAHCCLACQVGQLKRAVGDKSLCPSLTCCSTWPLCPYVEKLLAAPHLDTFALAVKLPAVIAAVEVSILYAPLAEWCHPGKCKKGKEQGQGDKRY